MTKKTAPSRETKMSTAEKLHSCKKNCRFISTRFISGWAAVLTVILLAGVLPSLAADDGVILSEIGGRVLDAERNPIANAQVKLLDENGDLLLSTQSSGDGSFALKHRPCVSCALQVVPDDKTSLASALIGRIPGDANRRILVTLQKGFRISGRITGDGKGLKGLLVKVVGPGDSSKRVYSGGECKTARDGSFAMRLTVGPKTLSVRNEKYMKFASKYDHEFDVSSDQTLPDINLPTTR